MDYKKITIRIPMDLHTIIYTLAKKYRKSFNSMIIEILRDGYLEHVKNID